MVSHKWIKKFVVSLLQSQSQKMTKSFRKFSNIGLVSVAQAEITFNFKNNKAL